MSDTPDTDAAVIAAGGDWSPVLRAVSQRLERQRDEARDEINIIRNTLSKNGEAVGNGEHDFSTIEMVENLMQSKDYFVRKSDSLERERDEARAELSLKQQTLTIAKGTLCDLRKELEDVRAQRDERESY